MCEMITEMEHGQSAQPIPNKCYVKVCVNDAGTSSVCMSQYPEWRKSSPVWCDTRVWLHKNIHLHKLLVLETAVLPLHKCVIIHDEGLIGCSKRSRGRVITVPISYYLHLFGYIKMQSKFSICVVVDLQFVLGLYFIWGSEMFKQSLIKRWLCAYPVLILLPLLGKCKTLWCGLQDVFEGYSDPRRPEAILLYSLPFFLYWETSMWETGRQRHCSF